MFSKPVRTCTFWYKIDYINYKSLAKHSVWNDKVVKPLKSGKKKGYFFANCIVPYYRINGASSALALFVASRSEYATLSPRQQMRRTTHAEQQLRKILSKKEADILNLPQEFIDSIEDNNDSGTFGFVTCVTIMFVAYGAVVFPFCTFFVVANYVGDANVEETNKNVNKNTTTTGKHYMFFMPYLSLYFCFLWLKFQ